VNVGGEVCLLQHYMIKFASDWWQVGKHRRSHNTGTIYLECIALVIEKDGLLTQVFT
jgi:hypothetical protein